MAYQSMIYHTIVWHVHIKYYQRQKETEGDKRRQKETEVRMRSAPGRRHLSLKHLCWIVSLSLTAFPPRLCSALYCACLRAGNVAVASDYRRVDPRRARVAHGARRVSRLWRCAGIGCQLLNEKCWNKWNLVGAGINILIFGLVECVWVTREGISQYTLRSRISRRTSSCTASALRFWTGCSPGWFTPPTSARCARQWPHARGRGSPSGGACQRLRQAPTTGPCFQ